VLAEGLALDSVGVQQRLAHLGQAHIQREQVAIDWGAGPAAAAAAGWSRLRR